MNGIDVSSFPHEDAVQVFLNAPEPIVVELKRRSATGSDSINSSTTSSSKSSCETASVKHQQQSVVGVTTTSTVMATSTAVQTDPINYHLSSLLHDGHNSEAGYAMQEFLYDESPTSDHQDDECLPPDIDIEVCNLYYFSTGTQILNLEIFENLKLKPFIKLLKQPPFLCIIPNKS